MKTQVASVHEGIKPFKCRVCDQTFYKRVAENNHSAIFVTMALITDHRIICIQALTESLS